MCCTKRHLKFSFFWHSYVRASQMFPNYNQQDATFLDLFISTDALHVSGGFLRPSSGAQNCTYSLRVLSTSTAASVSEIVRSAISPTLAAVLVDNTRRLYVKFCAPDDGRRNRLKHVKRGWDGTTYDLTHASSGTGGQYPKAVCTVLCSWWWAEEPPETCRASVEINKSRNVASCWL